MLNDENAKLLNEEVPTIKYIPCVSGKRNNGGIIATLHPFLRLDWYDSKESYTYKSNVEIFRLRSVTRKLMIKSRHHSDNHSWKNLKEDVSINERKIIEIKFTIFIKCKDTRIYKDYENLLKINIII